MDYLKEFSRIIIWGAGHLGEALGKELIKRNLPLCCYWDLKADNIKNCNGCPVYLPFHDVQTEERVLVIFGVTSGLIQTASTEKLQKSGYEYLPGMKVYQELMCPLNMDNFDITECCNRVECNVDTCDKLNQLIFQKYYVPEKILLETGYLFITQRCTLKCKYCIAYMNSYTKERKFNFDILRILSDIDRLAESCSYIKRVVIYGGEPFLHPQIDKIVERLSEKDNIGVIDIVSNGIFKQPEEILKKLKYRNLRIEFSNYEEALTPQQLAVRDENYKKMQELGLNPFLHHVTPEWIKPRTFYDKHWSLDEMQRLKNGCDYFCASRNNKVKQSMVIANGRFYPCRMACSVHTLGINDYDEDYIEVDRFTSDELVGAIEALYNRDYFWTCRHCEEKQGEITPIAGEQGFDERYQVNGSGEEYDI